MLAALLDAYGGGGGTVEGLWRGRQPFGGGGDVLRG